MKNFGFLIFILLLIGFIHLISADSEEKSNEGSTSSESKNSTSDTENDDDEDQEEESITDKPGNLLVEKTVQILNNIEVEEPHHHSNLTKNNTVSFNVSKHGEATTTSATMTSMKPEVLNATSGSSSVTNANHYANTSHPATNCELKKLSPTSKLSTEMSTSNTSLVSESKANQRRDLKTSNPTMKSEVSTHNSNLTEIENKLKSQEVNAELIRDVLKIIMGVGKADEMLKPSKRYARRYKRDADLNKLPGWDVKTADVKGETESMKASYPSKYKVKRSLKSDYSNADDDSSYIISPIPSEDLNPELVVPVISGSRSRSRSNSGNSNLRSSDNLRSTYSNPSDNGYSSSSSAFPSPDLNPEIIVPVINGRQSRINVDIRELRNLYDLYQFAEPTAPPSFRYAFRLNRPTSGLYRSSAVPNSRSTNRNFGIRDFSEPMYTPRQLISARITPKFITDLSDLPQSRDYPFIRIQTSPDVLKATTSSPLVSDFHRVRVAYEYDTPVQGTTSNRQASDTGMIDSGAIVRSGNSYDSFPNEIPMESNDDVPISDAIMESSGRYKRASRPDDHSKRRVPMVLSTVSRLTRTGPL